MEWYYQGITRLWIMHTIIFVITYAYLYKWARLGRLTDRLELPPLFWGILAGFILYDLVASGIIPTENE